MKTEKDVKKKLRIAEHELMQTQVRFDRYDNHDDMEELDRLRREVETLKWVLAK